MRPLSRFLIRAPLLPVASLRQPAAKIFRQALPQQALAWASPSLAQSSGAAADRARENYARRAAFRPTPHGLWAGVLAGELGPRLRVATGEPRAHLAVSYATRWREARAALDDARLREATRLRVAPSLIADDRQAEWLAFGEGSEAVSRTAEMDSHLAATLEAAGDWVPWTALREIVDDEYLLGLIDDGLLVSDREPPLVGAAPPRSDELAGSHAVLSFDGSAIFPAATVERAANLAPLLLRLQQALTPPAFERRQVPLAAVETAVEIFGAGAFDLAALMRGDYGVLFEGENTFQPELLAYFAERLHENVLELNGDELDALLPPIDLPPTCELFLQPTRDARGRGWLVGLHGPAGSSWGRFAHALGEPLALALRELADAEMRARPGEERLDVSYAPSLALADLCSHPPLRNGALALIGWCDHAVPLSALELVADPAALEPLALRVGDHPVAPSPLHRLRSTTAPPGGHRLLAAWSLQRQHAPWAFSWGPLASLPRLPRVTVDGFVVAPENWRLPRNLSEFRRWRKTLPRHVQVGQEDELLLVDLHAKDTWSRLQKLSGRAWEVWPPLAETPDRDGRRLEAVIALVDEAPSERTRAAIAATASAGRVPLPEPAPGWLTYKLFGAPDRADGVLLGAIKPFLDENRGNLSQWFYLRYEEAGRPHLRLRLLPRNDVHESLMAHLQPARDAFDVVAVERADYFREAARYGVVPEDVFQLDSEHCLALLEAEPDPLHRLLLALDTLASQLEVPERRALAARRRQLHPLDEEPVEEFRARQRNLIELLAHPPEPTLRIRRALPPIDGKLLPTLLHLSAVRLDASAEALAYYFWERALDGLMHAKPRTPRAP